MVVKKNKQNKQYKQIKIFKKMKRILILFLAVGTFLAANGQKQIEYKTKYSVDRAEVSAEKVNELFTNAAKAIIKYDTMATVTISSNPEWKGAGSVWIWGAYPDFDGYDMWACEAGGFRWGTGNQLAGGGETGVSFMTEDNFYVELTGYEVANKVVVGAILRGIRLGNITAWNKAGHDTIPDMPIYMKIRPVVEQNYEIASMGDLYNEDLVASFTPVSLDNYYLSDTVMWPLSYRDPENMAAIYSSQRSFMFDHPMDASDNFGLSWIVPDGTDFDSLWMWTVPEISTVTSPMLTGATYSVIDVAKQTAIFNPKDPNYVFTRSLFLEPDNIQYENETDTTVIFFPTRCFGMVSDGALVDPAMVVYALLTDGTANESLDPKALNISIYPVPADDKVQIVSAVSIKTVEIYSLSGAVVLANRAVNDMVVDMDVSGLKPGLYVAKINTEEGIVTKKLIVK